jgi:hypothetical protein
MDKYLINNLCDLLGSYIDEKTYQILIKINPKIFTKNKLILNLTENISLNEIILISKSYNYSKEWLKITDHFFGAIDLIGMFIEYIKFFGEYKYPEKLNELRMYEYIKSRSIHYHNEHDLNIERDVSKYKASIKYDMKTNVNISKIFENSTENFKNEFSKLVNTKLDNNEIVYKFEKYLIYEIYKLMNLDPEFHPFKNIETYSDKLLNMIIESLIERCKAKN